ncbi:MAG: cyclase family protein [Proteobacteria bacterium]|nr:cyclase family protein [Pseudomonadota bacterium]
MSIAGKDYRADLARPRSLAIPLLFDGAQPGFFAAPPASAAPYKGGNFVGDTGLGGSCNVSEIRIVPHCNGTHTENVGHIVRTDVPVHASVAQGLMPALVISVTPSPDRATGDRTISRQDLAGVKKMDDVAALIVRTLPNLPSKKSVIYDDRHAPPYFSEDAMRHIVDEGFRHLLVDFPSIDRTHDQGALANHRLFWNVAPGSKETGPETRTDKTVTEMIFVDDRVADGLYLLDLQVPAWHSDAAPSNPVLYPLTIDS